MTYTLCYSFFGDKKMNKRLVIISIILICVFGYFYLIKDVRVSEERYVSYNVDDIIGYINIDELSLTKHLMQGFDNTFYLNHNYLKVENSAGEFFLDYQGDIKNNNNVIIYTKSENIDINKLNMNSIINIKYLDENYCFQVNSVKKDLILKVFKENEEIDILCKKIMC